ncbi:MAG: hypothetical protein NVS2B1_14460 [Bradyrhizobium sp.]
MLSAEPSAFRAQYQVLVSSGAIEPDFAQAEAAEAFADLERRLVGYTPVRKQGLLGRLFADKHGSPPRGRFSIRHRWGAIDATPYAPGR